METSADTLRNSLETARVELLDLGLRNQDGVVAPVAQVRRGDSGRGAGGDLR